MKIQQQKFFASFLFLLSGFTSLVFQVVWLKKLVLVFGNTVWAVSTLLTAFMGGLALGSWLIGRLADRVESPLRLYGLLEGIIGIYGLFTPLLFLWLPHLYIPLYRLIGGDNFLMGLIKFVLGMCLLLLPTICMGGTLPLLSSHFTRNIENTGSLIGHLYTINTMGAVLGTFVSGFYLIPFLGLRKTVFLASALCLTILFGTYLIPPYQRWRLTLTPALHKSSRLSIRGHWMLGVYFFCGFTGLAYEVLWNRVLVLHLGSNVYSYSIMLTVYLLGIVLGAGIMSHYLPSVVQPVRLFSIIQLVLGFYLLIQIPQFGRLAETLHATLKFLGGDDSYIAYIASLALGVFQLLIVPTLLFGASFPLAVTLFVTDRGKVGQETGILYASNTFGTIFGAFCTGFVLLPLLGAQRSLLLIASLNLSIGVFLLLKTELATQKKFVLSLVVFVSFYAGYNLFTYPNQLLVTAGAFQDKEYVDVKILTLEEDVYATVTVEEVDEPRAKWRQLRLNAVNVAGTSSELFTIQKLQGHLPLLLHHNPKTVLHIGFGSGGTAYAVSCHPVENITIAEISKSVIEKAAAYFQEINHNVQHDPRVKIVFTDGRNKVLASSERYDVILSDSIHPRFSGNGSLYTYEYYQLLKQRLNPGGVVSQWLPFYSLTPENFKMIIKSFYEVFPHCSIWYVNSTFNAYVIVIGQLDTSMIDYASIETKLSYPKVKADLQEIEIETPYKILDYFLFANEEVGKFVEGIPLHTDDNMAVEYISGRVLDRQRTSYENYKSLLGHRTSVINYLTHFEQAQEDREQILSTLTRYETATMYNLQGQLLLYEGKQQEAFRQFNQIRSINPDDLEPVGYFGASYQKPFYHLVKFPALEEQK